MQSRISYFWKEADARKPFRTGISLHSHTNHSRESLSFVSVFASRSAVVEWYLEHHQRKASRRGVAIDLFRACWTPPLAAREAYEVERKQIEDVLGLEAVVSLTDHDNIEASTRLRVVQGYGNVPISVEWTVPFREAHFHLGVHNLPGRRAAAIMADLAAYTANPRMERLDELFRHLHEFEGVLIVFNHPKWNLTFLKPDRFNYLLTDFLSRYSVFIHAFELNGLRSWRENQEVAKLAHGWNQVVISGGDRHGREPNGNVNMTNARSFDEFVQEVRVRRISHIMFMPQYADPIAMRFVQTFLDVIREYPDKPEGARNWDDRTLHPDPDGVLKPISAQWTEPPYLIHQIFELARRLESGFASRLWRAAARNETFRLHLIDGEQIV
ncbi:MAG TPA: hypothetical protein VMU05_01035 [Dongiaceae bacterium]|nr:hypothetical protein [Dongiaceae bacterium]